MRKPESVTVKNIEAAFAGESMAHIKYRYFAKLARAAAAELDGQIVESTEHAERFRATLAKAAGRFAALAKVEERHANQYRARLSRVTAQ